MHRKCYYHYHSVRYGVYLDNRYEINHSRRKHKSLKAINRRDVYFVWKAMQPDVHSSNSDYGSHSSQEDRERGSWESSSGEEEEKDEEDAKHAKQEPTVPQDAPEV